MSNSSLISYTRISPNKTSPRNHAIDTITIHCVVGQLSAESICGCFATTSAQASCNYGIGTDGRIALCVDEKDRSWCSSNGANDHRAVTIECASDTTHPYAINGKVYDSLIKLCADICKRNGIKELKWKADPSLIGQIDKQNMTVHRWFANKACPGDYIYERLGKIAEEVNVLLGIKVEKTTTTDKTNYPATPFAVKVMVDNLKCYAKASKDSTVVGKTGKGTFTIIEVSNGFGKLKSGFGWIRLNNPKKCLIQDTIKSSAKCKQDTPFEVRISASDLNIRTGPGTAYETTGQYTGLGTFTIVEVQDGPGSETGWGRLKSGAGWIALDYTTRI